MRRLFTAFIALATATVTAAVVAPAPAQAATGWPLRIVAIQYDPPGADTTSNAQLNAEWIAVRNVAPVRANISGWRIADPAGHVYTFGTVTTINPGATIYVHTGKGTNTFVHRYWNRSWYVWNNTGDTAYLRTNTGAYVSHCAYRGGGQIAYC
jgi:hypothetical protein